MTAPPPRLSLLGKLGIALVVFSTLLWLVLLVLPFLPLTTAQKALAATVMVVVAEIMFWLGALLAGREVVQKYRDRLHPKQIWRQVKKIWRRIT